MNLNYKLIQYCLHFVVGDNVFLPVILQKLMCKKTGHHVLISRYQAEIKKISAHTVDKVSDFVGSFFVFIMSGANSS